jgi:hypothetical protein
MPPVGSTGQVAGDRRLGVPGEGFRHYPAPGARRRRVWLVATATRVAVTPLAAGPRRLGVVWQPVGPDRRSHCTTGDKSAAPVTRPHGHRGKTWPDTGLPPAAIRADGCGSGGRRRTVKGSHDSRPWSALSDANAAVSGAAGQRWRRAVPGRRGHRAGPADARRSDGVTHHRAAGSRPWGLAGGGPGAAGENWLLPGGDKSRTERLPDKCTIRMKAGDVLGMPTGGDNLRTKAKASRGTGSWAAAAPTSG